MEVFEDICLSSTICVITIWLCPGPDTVVFTIHLESLSANAIACIVVPASLKTDRHIFSIEYRRFHNGLASPGCLYCCANEESGTPECKYNCFSLSVDTIGVITRCRYRCACNESVIPAIPPTNPQKILNIVSLP